MSNPEEANVGKSGSIHNTNPPQILSRDWWVRVTERWNASPHRYRLARFGSARFLVRDPGYPPIQVEWDSGGFAHLIDGTSAAVSFAAGADTWIAFVTGEFTAAVGILDGRIEFKGPALAILPYTEAFDFVALEARQVTSG